MGEMTVDLPGPAANDQHDSKKERETFQKMLCSPFFNSREDLVRLADCLFGGCDLDTDKEKAFAALCPGKQFDLPKLRLGMTALQQLAERFLSLTQWEQTPWQQRKNLVLAYQKRGLEEHFKTALQQTEVEMEAQPLRNVLYYNELGHLQWEVSRLHSAHDPADTRSLESAGRAADIVWLAQKLRYLCLMKVFV